MSSESDQEAKQNRYKMRSSLKKASEDVQPPPPRRVSFAANSTVKPFVNDGDHTIWDNTYEEELNSANSLNKFNGTKMTADMSFTCCNLGNFMDKENIVPKANRTELALCEMEFTCQIKDDDYEEPMDIDVTNRSMYVENDMSLTCKFPEVKVIVSTNHSENVVDDSMEFTCQFSPECNKVIMKPQESEACNIEEEQTNILIQSDHIIETFKTVPEENLVTTLSDKVVKSETDEETEVCNTNKEEIVDIKPDIQKQENVNQLDRLTGIALSDKVVKSSTDQNTKVSMTFREEVLVVKTELNTSIEKYENVSSRLNSTTCTAFSDKVVQSSTDVLASFKEVVEAVKTEFDIDLQEHGLETFNSSFQEIKKEESCTNEDEISLANIINTHTNATILEEQCDLVNLTDIERSLVDMSMMPSNLASNSNAQSTVDNTQALIDAASSSIIINSSMDQMLESVNKFLENFQLISYKPVSLDLTKCCAVIQKSQEVLKKASECLTNYQPPIPATSLESRLSRQSLTSTSSESNNLTRKDSCDEYLDAYSDDTVMELPKPLTEQIRDVFDQSEPANLQLIEMEEQTVFFTTFSNSIWFRVDLHEENDTVEGLTSLQLLKEASEDCHHSLCKFLVEHIMSKTQMDQLTSSLGQRFDMLSLLEYLHMITDKCYDFFWMFLMLQR